MPNTLTRASELLRKHVPASDQVTDEKITATCPECATTQTLAEGSVTHEGNETAYRCKKGCRVLLVIGDPEEDAPQGRGYRVGPCMLRNSVDLFVHAGGAAPVMFKARPHALDAR